MRPRRQRQVTEPAFVVSGPTLRSQPALKPRLSSSPPVLTSIFKPSKLAVKFFFFFFKPNNYQKCILKMPQDAVEERGSSVIFIYIYKKFYFFFLKKVP